MNEEDQQRLVHLLQTIIDAASPIRGPRITVSEIVSALTLVTPMIREESVSGIERMSRKIKELALELAEVKRQIQELKTEKDPNTASFARALKAEVDVAAAETAETFGIRLIDMPINPADPK